MMLRYMEDAVRLLCNYLCFHGRSIVEVLTSDAAEPFMNYE